MTKCTDSGCRNLQTTCADCGRVVCTKTFKDPIEHPLDKIIVDMDSLIKTLEHLHEEISKFQWIRIEDGRPPRMRDVLLLSDGKIYMGWDECVQLEEDPSFCCFDHTFDEESVTHWMRLPPLPDGK